MQKTYLSNHIIIITLIIVNLIAGLYTVTDFGESWDEQSLREYTVQSEKAYSCFLCNLESNDFFQGNILRYYGPAYLLIASGLIHLFQFLGNELSEINLWHVVNLLSFQIGILSFYIIGRRFLKPWAANAITILFSTQPLLWGHAFINPKDIPFMSFFLASVAAGFWMADSFMEIDTISDEKKPLFERKSMGENWKEASAKLRTTFWLMAVVWILLLIVKIFHTGVIDTFLSPLIQFMYAADSNSFAGSIFSRFAAHADELGMQLYIDKAARWILTAENIALLFTSGIILLISIRLFPTFYSRLYNWHIKPFVSTASKALLKPQAWIAGILLGICISIRAIGPAAGLLVAAYLVLRMRRISLPLLLDYVLVAFVMTVLTWPYLWGDIFARYFESMSVMSQFPFGADVLFQGQYFQPSLLPSFYVPLLMFYQFTEPALVLFFLGLVLSIHCFIQNRPQKIYLALFYGWFFLPLFLLVIVRPALYDNFRQFFFIIPPLFFIAGIALEFFLEKVGRNIFKVLAVVILAAPGIISIIHLHPYSYAYYNQFAGGINGAYRQYELDYWAISFKEATEYLNRQAPQNAHIIASEPVHIVKDYARDDLIIDLYPSGDEPVSGNYDYAIVTTRLEKDTYIFPEAQTVYRVGKDGADFAVVKKISP